MEIFFLRTDIIRALGAGVASSLGVYHSSIFNRLITFNKGIMGDNREFVLGSISFGDLLGVDLTNQAELRNIARRAIQRGLKPEQVQFEVLP